MLRRSSVIVMSFERIAFRRSLLRPAIHGRKCCPRESVESGRLRAIQSSEMKMYKDSNFDCSCCPRAGATLTPPEF